jgi:hypothetical protein
MTGGVIAVWWHSDGRRLPFNHPDAIAERSAAISGWRSKYDDGVALTSAFHPRATWWGNLCFRIWLLFHRWPSKGSTETAEIER